MGGTRRRARRTSGRLDAAVGGIGAWIIAQALVGTTAERLFAGVCRKLRGAGFDLGRATLTISTLHPMLEARAYVWRQGRGLAADQFLHGMQANARWRESPFHHMLENRRWFLRRRLRGPKARLDFPILTEIRDQGVADYLAVVTSFGRGPDALSRRDGMITSWATARRSGFTVGEIAALRRLVPSLGAAIKARVREEAAANVVGAYLGRDAGRRVLAGQIKLGDGERIRAVIWFSDLRGSSALADRLSGERFLALLNDYFQCTAGAVLDGGGEVLRFIGDAVLAIFPCPAGRRAQPAARAALAAVAEAEARRRTINAERLGGTAPPIDFGIALHVGEVMFGNIGVPQRVEFTVIGPAANEAARLEGLTKTLKRPVLVSDRIARLVDVPWIPLGRHALQGVGGTMAVFAPPPATEAPAT